jgi:hypothetical protein
VGGTACTLGCECLSNACPTVYRDADGDTFGTAATTSHFCAGAIPAGWTADNTDCCDTDARAFPGQTMYFSTQRTGCGAGYDFDCDTVETPLLTAITTCGDNGALTCCAHDCAGNFPGWTTSAPACGHTAKYTTSCSRVDKGMCATDPTCKVTCDSVTDMTHTQSCR